ncbi:carboxymuconolactone decarboxylase family protein [Streptomyces sp. S1D4-11]
MNRIPPLPYDEWDTEALASLAPGRRLPPSNVLGLFAQHPELATAFLGYNRYLLGGGSTLSPRTRELAILRVAWRRRCQYEWVQHVLIARKAGVTDEEIDAIRAISRPRSPGRWTNWRRIRACPTTPTGCSPPSWTTGS